MKALMRSAIVAALFTSAAAIAAPPADAPAGTMGQCKDGSYSSSAEKKGACRGHKGVKDWYGADAAAPSGKAAPAAAAATATGTTDVTPSTKSVAATSPKTGTPTATQAPGGGAGQVWANTSSKVYHCSGDKWYGKTKAGDYMTEADAKAKGFHAEHGKACG